MVSLKPDTENLAPTCLEFKQAFETSHECPGDKLVRFHNKSKIINIIILLILVTYRLLRYNYVYIFSQNVGKSLKTLK